MGCLWLPLHPHRTRVAAAASLQEQRSRDDETMDAPVWFILLACLGALYVAALCARPLAYLALCLRRSKDLHGYGSWAIVTGPTSGLGRSMAMELARRGLNLVLLDLDAANLQETSDVITSRHGVMTRTVVFDLSLVGTPQGVDRHIIFYQAIFVHVCVEPLAPASAIDSH